MAIENRFNLQINSYSMGNDRVYHIFGGQAHIGAVATAYERGEGIQTGLHVLPGHREDQLAVELAEYACSRLGCTVTVVIGIHFDNATKEMIRQIVRDTRELMRAKIEQERKEG